MELTINDTNENFETWLNKKFVTEDLKKLIVNKPILLVPFENLRDAPNPLMFPIGTENLLKYFRDNLPENQEIEICIEDEDYQEFTFYSDYKRLGNF